LVYKGVKSLLLCFDEFSEASKSFSALHHFQLCSTLHGGMGFVFLFLIFCQNFLEG